MNGITVFTPTYNREKYLTTLYESLLNQELDKFEWLIVDDGSSDNTRTLVESLINENKIKIRYKYQNNAGKHVAFNTGVTYASYDLFLCVDSDDYLVDGALKRIYEKWDEVKNSKNNICGLLAYRGKSENQTMFGEKFDNPLSFSTVKKEMKHRMFETTMVQRTDVLKKFPFPTFEGENFITEDIVWRQIDQEYVYYVVPEVWTICSYLSDGLTNTTNIFKYPKGEAEYYKIRYNSEDNLLNKMKEYARYLVFDKTRLKGKYGNLFYLPALILSNVYYIVWKLRFK